MSRGNKTYPEQLTVYATAAEKKEIDRRARESSASSRSRYVVEAAAEGAIIEVQTAPGAGASQVAGALGEIKDELEGLTYQINRAGVNLNTFLQKVEAAGEKGIVSRKELGEAIEEVRQAAASVAAEAGGVQQEIDAARAEAERRERSAIEYAKKTTD